MAQKKVKKAARKPAKKVVRVARKAKAKAAPRPMKKKTAAKRAAARPAKKARTAKSRPAMAKRAKATKSAKVTKRSAPKAAARKKPVTVVRAKPTAAARPKAMTRPKAKPAPATNRLVALPPPHLQRERRRLPEAEAETFGSSSDDLRLMSSAKAGHDDLRSELKQHTEASPEMTAGDVDAKWQDAYAVGDEAPGGDNMTPDQDRVDDIGKALGIEYADDEELLGGEELVERDEHRWELDPASKEDDEEL